MQRLIAAPFPSAGVGARAPALPPMVNRFPDQENLDPNLASGGAGAGRTAGGGGAPPPGSMEEGL